MEEKVHCQSSDFFAQQKKYKRFEEYLHHHGMDPRRIPFSELSFKVCGYGYFEKYKQHMKLKFREYLWQSCHACPELNTLKIVFNGFVINSSDSQREEGQQLKSNEEHIFLDILETVLDIVRKKKLKVFHLHTTHLRKCTQKDLIKLFNLISVLGNDICEDVSIQLADWQFQGGYPEYTSLTQLFTNFVQDKPESLRFKKFRLELSSWYMKEKQAYKVLCKTLDTEQLVKKFKKEQKPAPKQKKEPQGEESQMNREETENIQDVDFPNIPAEQREETMQALLLFLEHMDQRYYHPKYKYKKTHQKYSHQEEMAHQQMLEQLKKNQEMVSQRLVKYPVEFVMGLRVEEFHAQMAKFVLNLLNKMTVVQDYHIDLRNWNGMFNMSGLKKLLDTKELKNKIQYSVIRKSLSPYARVPAKEGEEVKTTYTV